MFRLQITRDVAHPAATRAGLTLRCPERARAAFFAAVAGCVGLPRPHVALHRAPGAESGPTGWASVAEHTGNGTVLGAGWADLCARTPDAVTLPAIR